MADPAGPEEFTSADRRFLMIAARPPAFHWINLVLGILLLLIPLVSTLLAEMGFETEAALPPVVAFASLAVGLLLLRTAYFALLARRFLARRGYLGVAKWMGHPAPKRIP